MPMHPPSPPFMANRQVLAQTTPSSQMDSLATGKWMTGWATPVPQELITPVMHQAMAIQEPGPMVSPQPQANSASAQNMMVWVVMSHSRPQTPLFLTPIAGAFLHGLMQVLLAP